MSSAYAAWVEPIARRDREARAELVAFARVLPEAAWERPSPVDGWTYHDVLAHLAGATGKWFRYILESVIGGCPLDPGRVGRGVDIHAINASDIDQRRDRARDELLAEIEQDGEEHQQSLGCLSETDRNLRQDVYPTTFEEYLTHNPAGSRGGHDREHLEHLRAALNG